MFSIPRLGQSAGTSQTLSADTGDEVVLLGRQGDLEVTAQELASWADTIPYEVLCYFGLRLPHRYQQGGTDIAFNSRFSG